MPLLKSNKHMEQAAVNPQTSNLGPTDGYPSQDNNFNGAPSRNIQSTGVDGHHGNHTDPAVRPHGIHNTEDLTAQGATTHVDGATIPAAGAATKGKGAAGASEKAFVGKLEHVAGTLLCSSSLKAKGIQKEREAQALKVQAAELSAAERLEEEAKMRRERAVAHGADPRILQQGPHGQQQQQQQQHYGQQQEQYHGQQQQQRQPLQQGDMGTAVDSGAPNMAGLGTGPAHTMGNTPAPQFGNNTAQHGMPLNNEAMGATGGVMGPGPVTGGVSQAGIGSMPHAAHMQPASAPNYVQGQAHPMQNHGQGLAGDSAYPPMSRMEGVQ